MLFRSPSRGKGESSEGWDGSRRSAVIRGERKREKMGRKRRVATSSWTDGPGKEDATDVTFSAWKKPEVSEEGYALR